MSTARRRAARQGCLAWVLVLLAAGAAGGDVFGLWRLPW